MPRLIDHQTRAIEVTEAAWRILVRDGARAVSVRNVAAEAGLATASLRRAFPTQASLLASCLTLMADRVARRILALPPTDDPVARSLARLRETLPLDAERRVEMEVYLALGTVALSDPDLRDIYATVHSGLAHLCEVVVTDLSPGLDDAVLRREVWHLHAVIDGLALHVLHGLATEDADAVVSEHLSRLTTRAVPLG